LAGSAVMGFAQCEAAGRHDAANRSRRWRRIGRLPDSGEHRINHWRGDHAGGSWRHCSKTRRAWADRAGTAPLTTEAGDLLRRIEEQRAGRGFEKELDISNGDHRRPTGFYRLDFTARVVPHKHGRLIHSVCWRRFAVKGQRHGGAAPGLDMLDELGEASSAEAWFARSISQGHHPDGLRSSHLQGARTTRADVLRTTVAHACPRPAGRLRLRHRVGDGRHRRAGASTKPAAVSNSTSRITACAWRARGDAQAT